MSELSHDKLRQAAILITSLDAATADALLAQLGPEQEARIRAAAMELGDIELAEQQRVIQEFFNRNPHRPALEPGGVELDVSLAARLEHESATSPEQTTPAPPAALPFHSLRQVDAATLANLLIREHPQTISIVLSHLPPPCSAAALALLPVHLQTEVLMRIARRTEPAPEILQDIEAEMTARLAHTTPLAPFGASGLAAVQAILQACPEGQRRQCVAGLADQDRQLLAQLHYGPDSDTDSDDPATVAGLHAPAATPPPSSTRRSGPRGTHVPLPSPDPPPTWDFTDVERLEDSALARVLSQSDAHSTLLALAGASPTFVRRVLAQLPSREANQLQRQLRQLGPLRLDDIERAQDRLAAVAQQLFDAEPAPAASERFVMAA